MSSTHLASGLGTPWRAGQVAFRDGLRACVRFDSFVLGVIDPRHPRADGMLAAEAAEARALQAWCDGGFENDELLRDARRKGVAVGEPAADRTPLGGDQQVMVHLLPVSLLQRRWWYLAVGRSSGAFEEVEQQRAGLALRGLHAAFDHVSEPAVGRLLLGEDARLVHADAGTDALVLDQPGFLEELAEVLPALAGQRWPELSDGVTHDAALTLGGLPRWIRFHRGRAVTGLEHWHWYLELRPLDEDDIPALGVLEDDRVAQAVAYLSDHFDQAPTLGEVAETVHTSPFHFHRLFVRHVGRSPKHYLLRMQLMVAKWLLRATRSSIGEIATTTGFASHGHFTATFHRVVGQSPSQYRETG